jgi:hypothetical protein
MKNLIVLFLVSLYLLAVSLWGNNPISPIQRFGSDHLIDPIGIIAANGEIIVSETKLSHLVFLTAAGEYKTTLGSAGEGPLQFRMYGFSTVHRGLIYGYDHMGKRLTVFSQKDKSFMHYITLNKTAPRLLPHQMIFLPDDRMVFLNCGYLKEHTLMGIYSPQGKLQKSIFNAFPAYKSDSERDEDAKRHGHSNIDSLKNIGRIAFANGKIYYVNDIENHVTELDLNGTITGHCTIPLPSHEKTLKFISIKNGESIFWATENELTYAIKSVNNTIYILCRDNGISYIFRLVKGKFEEVCRMKEVLKTFDIMDNRIYCLEAEPENEDKGTEVLVYNLPKN